MLEIRRICYCLGVSLALAGCAAPEVVAPPAPAPPPPVAAPAPPPQPDAAAQEARAMLAQAETDIQRARGKRALWLKAWESLVLARQSAQSGDHGATVRHARRASELSELGLEQLAYPAVK